MKKIFIALVALLALISFCGAQGKPDWAKNLPDYPNRPEFYQGLGIARGSGDASTDWQKATNQARADVAAQIKVRIVSTLSREIRDESRNGRTNISDVFESSSKQLSETTLEGLVVQRWHDKKENIYYAYAAISKTEVETKLAESLRNSMKSAYAYRAAALKAVEEGDFWPALTNYLEAMKSVILAESHLGKVIVGDSDFFGSGRPVLPVIQNELCQLLGKIKFELSSGNDQAAERGKPLKEPLTGRILLATLGGLTPVRNAFLTPSFVAPASGTLPDVCRSDDLGEFKIFVNETISGEAVNTVRVNLSIKETAYLAEKMPEAIRCWINPSLEFTYQLRARTNTKIAMYISERNLGKPSAKSNVQEEIQGTLIGERYTIVEESQLFDVVPESTLSKAIDAGNYDEVIKSLSKLADIVVVGMVDTKMRSNPAEGIFFSTGTAIVRVVDSKTGQIIANAKIENEREAGNSYEVAGLKLLQRIGRQIGEEIRTKLRSALN